MSGFLLVHLHKLAGSQSNTGAAGAARYYSNMGGAGAAGYFYILAEMTAAVLVHGGYNYDGGVTCGAVESQADRFLRVVFGASCGWSWLRVESCGEFSVTGRQGDVHRRRQGRFVCPLGRTSGGFLLAAGIFI